RPERRADNGLSPEAHHDHAEPHRLPVPDRAPWRVPDPARRDPGPGPGGVRSRADVRHRISARRVGVLRPAGQVPGPRAAYRPPRRTRPGVLNRAGRQPPRVPGAREPGAPWSGAVVTAA